MLAHFSIRSLREHGVTEPIRVLTDLDTDLFDRDGVTTSRVTVPAGGHKPSRYIKTALGHHTPFAETLYLDCDVVCLGNIAAIWAASSDLALALDARPTVAECDHCTDEERAYTLAVCPGQAQWNSGVMLWRHCPALWQRWREEWLRYRNIDQLALSRTLHHLSLRPATLPEQYNHQGSTLDWAVECSAVLWHPWNDRFAYYRAKHGDEFDATYTRWCQLRPS